MADQCIGKLTLDISDVEAKVKKINETLSKLGTGVKIDMSKDISKEVKKQLDGVLKEIQGYQKKMAEAVDKAIDSGTKAAGQKIDDSNLKKAIDLWKQYYTIMAQAQNARNGNRNQQADFLESEAKKLVQNVQALKQQAEAYNVVAKAKRSYDSAIKAGEDRAAAKAATEALKEQAKANKELEAAAKARIKAQQAIDNQKLREEKEILNTLIDLYRRKAQMDTEATKAIASSNMDNANMYLKEEQAIEGVIQAIAKLYPELDKLAQADDRVADAELRRVAAANTAKQKAAEVDYKNLSENINAYANALATAYNEQAKFNQQVASGKLTEGSAQYAAAEEKLRNFEQAAIDAGLKLDDAGRKTAESMQQVKAAIDNLNVSVGALKDAEQVRILNQTENAYKQLTTAIKQYTTAKKAKNQDEMSYWQDQISGSMQVINLVEQEIGSLNVDVATREKIVSLINQAKTQQDALQKGVIGTTGASSELESQLTSIVTRFLSITALIRTVSGLISNMVDYVSEYSDKMNEIQIITQKSNEEVEKLSKTYRDLAADMNVSSNDMADAAIYFTRQGLLAEDIEKRLRSTTMYAKTANIEFERSAEMITAVVNSMKLVEQEAEDGRDAAQRVADVFMAVGDNAATSGEEIGEAMQKAAVSAGSFGVSFEWLASYIATVSETTRQDARSIGTALNAIIARLHSIKQTGYNSEDETKLNDISKALAKINVNLMDQDNNWRDMTDIFNDVAGQWDTLNDKTKSYIATTIAGTRQQNVFLALMNDMAKGIDGESRALELYNIAMDSAGTTELKYAIYKDSVAAAQERLNVAQENFYALLDENVIKGWNDAMAVYVGLIAKGGENMQGLNLIIPVLIGGIVAIGVVIKLVNAGLAQTITLTSILEKHPIMVALAAGAAAAVALVTIISAIAASVETASDRYERFGKTLRESQDEITRLKKLKKESDEMFADLKATNASEESLKKYNKTLDELAKVSPTAKKAVDDLKNGLIDQSEAFKIINEELDKNIKLQNQVSLYSMSNMYKNWTPTAIDEKKLEALSKWPKEALENTEAFIEQLKKATEDYTSRSGVYGDAKLLTKEMRDRIHKLFNDESIKEYTKDEKWRYVATAIWQEFFFGDNGADSIEKQIANEAEEMITSVMTTIASSYDVDMVQTNILKKMLFSAIAGEDGEIDLSEYKNMGQTVSKFISGIIIDGIQVSNEDILNYIAGELYGKEVLEKIADQIADNAGNSYIVEKISKGYQELLEAGFSKGEIAWALEGLDVDQWRNMVEYMTDTIKYQMEEAFGKDFFGDMDFSLTDMKLIMSMKDAGIEIEEFRKILDESDSVLEFITRLKNLKKTTGGEEDEVDVDLAGYMKSIKEAQKEIKTIDTMLDNMGKGKKISIEDRLELASAHPELVGVIGDLTKFEQVLKKIREDLYNDQKQSFKDMYLNNPEFIAYSEWADDAKGFENLKKYRESLDDNSDAAKEFDRKLEELAAEAINFSDTMDEATDSTGTFDNRVKKVVTELNTLDKVIKGLEEGTGVDFNDLVSLAELHPEIMSVISDEEQLKQKLIEIRNESRDTKKELLKELMMDSEVFYKNSKFYQEGSKYKTLREYTEAVADATEEVNKELDAAAESAVKYEEAIKSAFNIDAVKNYRTEIDNIDKVIKKIAEEGKITFDDIFEIASANPEIIAMTDNLETLKTKLIEIRDKTKAEQRTTLIDALLNSTDFASKQYADKMKEKGVDTLKKYIDLLPEGAEESAKLKKEIGDLVDKFLALQNVTDGQDTLDIIEKYKSEIESVDDIIAKITLTNNVTLDDLLGLTESHPELLAYLGDMEKLKEELENIRTAGQTQQRQTLFDYIMGSEGFAQASQFKDKLDESIKTLDDYVTNYTSERATVEAYVNGIIDLFINMKDEEKKTFSVANVRKYQSEIASLRDTVESLAKDGKISFDDVLQIAESHPAILTAMNDMDALKRKVKETIKEVQQTQKIEWTNALMTDSEFFKSTSYYNTLDANGNHYESLEKYVAAHQEAKVDVEKFVADIIAAWIAMEEAEERAFNAEKIMKYTSEIKNIESMIEGLQTSGTVDMDDFLGIAEAHPEILALTDDLDKMIAKLKELKGVTEAERENKLVDMLMGNDDFMKNSKYVNRVLNTEQLAGYDNLNQFVEAHATDADLIFMLKESVRLAAQEILNFGTAADNAFDPTNVQNYQKEIDRLDSMIEALDKGEKVGLDDILELTKTNPELLQLIGNLDQFKLKLKEIRGEQANKRNESFVDALMGDSGFLKTYNAELAKMYPTLNEYVKSHKDEEAGIRAELLKLIQTLFDYEEAEEYAFDISKVKEYESEISNLEKILKSLNNDEHVNFSDILGIAETHPEILLFIGDAERMKEAIEKIIEAEREAQKESLLNSVMKDKTFFANSEWNKKDGDGNQIFETLSQYLEKYPEKLAEVKVKLGQIIDSAKETEEELEKAFDIDSVQKYQTEIDNVNKIINGLGGQDDLGFNDIFGIASAHPEIIASIKDTKSLTEALKTLREELLKSQQNDMVNELIQNSAYVQKLIDQGRAKSEKDAEGIKKAAEEDAKAMIQWQTNWQRATEVAFDVTDIKKYQTEVDNLTKAIEGLDSDGTINFSDIIDIAGAHPEIINSISDIDQLREALKRLREEAKMREKAELRNQLMIDTGFMETSPFAGKYANFSQLIANADSDEAKAAKSHLNYIVDKLFEFVDAEEQAFDTSKVKSYTSELEKMGKVLEKLTNKEAIDFDDIFELVSSHPELAASIHDMKQLTEAIIKLRNETKVSRQNELKEQLIKDTNYIAELKNQKRISDENDKVGIEKAAEADAKALLEWRTAIQEAFDTTEIKQFKTEVDNLSKAIDAISQNGKIELDDIIDIAGEHPEILNYINDVDKMHDALKKLRQEQLNLERAAIRNQLMNDTEFMKNSPFAGKYDTFGNLIANASLGEAEAAKSYLDYIILYATDAGDAIENAFAAEKISGFTSELEQIDTILQNMKDHAEINFDDIFGLASAHPRLIAYIRDTKNLGKAIEDLQKEIIESRKTELVNQLVDNTDYIDELIKRGLVNNRADKDGIKKYANADAEALLGWKTVVEQAFDVTEVKQFETEISNLSKVIDTIDQNKKITINDIIDIANDHPEIMNYIGDIDKMREALVGLREEAQKNAKNTLRNQLMNDKEFMRKSGFNADKYGTFAGLFANASSTSEQEAAKRYLDYIIEHAEEFGLAVEKAFDTSKISGFTTELQKIDSVLTALTENGSVDFGDIFDIASSHPEIIASIRDTDNLKDALVKLRNEIADTRKSDLVTELIANKDYVDSLVAQGIVSSVAATEEIKRAAEADAAALLNMKAAVEKAFDTTTIKQFRTEIEKLDEAIDGITNDGKIGTDDVLNFAEKNPELLNYVGNLEELRKKLEEIRKERQEGLKQEMREQMMTSTAFMAESPFAGTYGTFKDLIAGNSTWAKEAINYIETIINATLGLDEVIEDTFSTDLLKSFDTEIGQIDTALQHLKENGRIDFSDLLNLAQTHPEILQFLGDTKKLQEKLESLRRTTRASAREDLVEMILGSEDFKSSSEYADLAGKTLNEAMKKVSKEEADKIRNQVTMMVNNAMSLLDQMNKEAAAEEEKTDFANEINSAVSDIEKLNSAIDALNNGEKIKFSDLMDLQTAHPEIMTVINDEEALLALLKEINKERSRATVSNIEKLASSSDKFFKNSPFYGMSYYDDNDVEHKIETIDELMEHSSFFMKETIDEVKQYMHEQVIGYLGATEQLASINKDLIGEWMEEMFPDSNADLLHRKVLQLGDEIATVMTETYTASADGHEGIPWNQDVVINLTPITPDGELLDEESLNNYVDELFAKSANIDELFENDKLENGGKGLLISADVDFDSFDEGIDRSVKLAKLLHLLQEAFYGVADANKTWLEVELEQAEATANLNWAESTGFSGQIAELQDAMTDGGIEKAMTIWNTYSEDMQKAITQRYPALLRALRQTEEALDETGKATGDVTKQTDAMNKALNDASRSNAVKHMKSTNDAIEKLAKGTISATEAYEAFNNEVDKVVKAHEDINDVYEKMANGDEVLVTDVTNLANIIGWSTDQVLDDFDGAQMAFYELISAGGELEDVFNRLNEAAFLRITGTSDVDFSALQDGIITTIGLTQDMLDLLVKTGQWQVETVDLEGLAWVFENGKWVQKKLEGMQQILRPTGNNPYKGITSTGNRTKNNSNRSSGGGSSNTDRDKNSMTEVERRLAEMEAMQSIMEYQRGYYQSQNKYFEQTGYLQGVIDAAEKEIKILEKENNTYEQNIRWIEDMMEVKREELASMSETDEEYETALDDLDKLQKAHQTYSKALLENKTAVDSLTKSITDQQKKIRDMQISIRELILKAIEDREAKTKNMLENEISMENIILDLIKKRYEEERDNILNNTKLKIDSLNKEKDILAEQLQLRKAQYETDNKQRQLALYEEQYARISADPTRQKEALSIMQNIQKLREEMAWDTAEKEVEAQQQSIDQQVTSLEEYQEYVTNYYENLFKHPQALIDEMRQIIEGTDDEIIEWLIKNSEEYAASSENTQSKMVTDWQDTLDNMRGKVKTHWEEVEEIIAGGDENIINFLKDNSAEYATAGKLQAEKYVEEWKKQLDDLHKAVQDAFAIEPAEYDVIVNNGSGGGSSRSSSGGGGGGGTTKKASDKLHYYKLTDYNGHELYDWVQATSAEVAKEKMKKVSNKIFVSGELTEAEVAVKKKKGGKQYKKGGIADFTGYAWMDGTLEDPERILSPYQTELFETMVHALEKMSRVSVPGMPYYGDMTTGSGNNVSVGDIIVNVDNLDTDDDYEELAQKVSEVLMERIGKTAVVGGLRINSI